MKDGTLYQINRISLGIMLGMVQVNPVWAFMELKDLSVSEPISKTMVAKFFDCELQTKEIDDPIICNLVKHAVSNTEFSTSRSRTLLINALDLNNHLKDLMFIEISSNTDKAIIYYLNED